MLTGERTVPGIPEENYWFRRHEVVYEALAARCCRRRRAGGRAAARATAPTCWPASRAGCSRWTTTRSPPRTSPAATRASTCCAPTWWRCRCATGSVDAVVSLQVIEHLWEQERFLRECRRVLRARRAAAGVHPEPDHLLPRPRHPAQPVPHPRAGRRRAGRAGRRRRVHAGRAAAGCTTGRGCASWTPPTAARSSTRRRRWCWAAASGPRTCCADVASVSLRATSTSPTATSTRAWTCWSRRCARDARCPARSAWSCTATCRGSRTTAAGPSARSGCTRAGRTPTCPSSTCWSGWPPTGTATCSPSASRPCSPRSSTIRTACAGCTTGSATGSCARTAWPRGCRSWPRTSTARSAAGAGAVRDALAPRRVAGAAPARRRAA